MWETIELRELRMFLVLAEERHFGRTPERLWVSASRVSQLLRSLEQRLGVTAGRQAQRISAKRP